MLIEIIHILLRSWQAYTMWVGSTTFGIFLPVFVMVIIVGGQIAAGGKLAILKVVARMKMWPFLATLAIYSATFFYCIIFVIHSDHSYLKNVAAAQRSLLYGSEAHTGLVAQNADLKRQVDQLMEENAFLKPKGTNNYDKYDLMYVDHDLEELIKYPNKEQNVQPDTILEDISNYNIASLIYQHLKDIKDSDIRSQSRYWSEVTEYKKNYYDFLSDEKEFEANMVERIEKKLLPSENKDDLSPIVLRYSLIRTSGVSKEDIKNVPSMKKTISSGWEWLEEKFIVVAKDKLYSENAEKNLKKSLGIELSAKKIASHFSN